MTRTPGRPAAWSLLLAVALPIAPLAAQQVYVPDKDAATGRINAVPLGSKGPTGAFQDIRSQTLIPASFLPSTGSAITEVALASGDDGSYRYSVLRVRLAHLKGESLTTVFDDNLAGAEIVLDARNTSVAMTKDAFSPLGLTTPFTHDGKRDLVVEIVIQGTFFTGATAGTRRSSTLPVIYELAHDPDRPARTGHGPFLAGAKTCLTLKGGKNIVLFGSGCPKPDARPVLIDWLGDGKLGRTLTVQAVRAPAKAPLLLMLGSSDDRFGSLRLPFDLAPIGAPGCKLYTDVLATLSATASDAGTGSVPLALPSDPWLGGRRLNLQWAVPVSGANQLGLVTSAVLRVTLQ